MFSEVSAILNEDSFQASGDISRFGDALDNQVPLNIKSMLSEDTFHPRYGSLDDLI
jgi:hypothetical protein